LPEVINWHHAILRNARTKARWRRAAVFSLFDLTFDTSNYVGALEAAGAGLQHEPDSVDYQLMRADALIALNRWNEAQALLERLKRDALAADRSDAIAALRAKIDRHRDHQPAPPRSLAK